MNFPLEFDNFKQKITDALRSRVSEDAYGRWFKELSVCSASETDVVFRVKDAIHQVWIEQNYADLIQDIVLTTLGQPRRVFFTVDENSSDDGGKIVHGAARMGKKEKGARISVGERPVMQRKAGALNPHFTFKNYVVGQNNQFASAAAKSVVEDPSSHYSPLFIYGGSGLGKTHLMQAIGNAIAEQRGAESVVYLTCEQFTNEYIDAIRNNSMTKFRRKYRKAEVLLLDDVQFFGGKERTREEFFHTFNSLFNEQKLIVLTSDCPACEISKLDSRLVSRFECGLTVELQAPCLETRVAILRQKRDDMNVKVDDHILQYLAERIRKNVRRLEGALMRIATFTSLVQENPSFESIEELLKDILREETDRSVTIDLIQRQVAEYYDIRLVDMTSRRRPANIALARQVAMYLSRQMTRASLVEIGEAFGGRDHGTVIHATRTIESKMGSDHVLRDAVNRIDSLLR